MPSDLTGERLELYQLARLDPDGLFSTDDAAALLGQTKRRLAYWRYKGRGPAYAHTPGYPVLYRARDLLAFLGDEPAPTAARPKPAVQLPDVRLTRAEEEVMLSHAFYKLDRLEAY
jgi:hypothetical protein